MKTTLNKIRKHSPCQDGWTKLLAHLGKTKADDEPLTILTILDSNGLDDALWCLRAVDGADGAIRKLACDFALDVADLWEMPDVVRQYLETQDEDFRDAARDAAWDVWAARDAEDAWAAWAARAARDAAWDAEAAWAAAAAGDAARAAARAKQEAILRAVLEGKK